MYVNKLELLMNMPEMTAKQGINILQKTLNMVQYERVCIIENNGETLLKIVKNSRLLFENREKGVIIR